MKKDWNKIFEAIPDEEQDKLALLRVSAFIVNTTRPTITIIFFIVFTIFAEFFHLEQSKKYLYVAI